MDRSPLQADFRFEAYNKILFTRDAGLHDVSLEGVRAQSLVVPLAAATAGLQSRGSAAFDGVALTAYYRDTFVAPSAAWEPAGGTWVTEEGALHQVQGGAARYLALRGVAADDYELVANVRWRDEESVGSLAGVVAAAAGDDLVLAGFDRTIWPFARFHVQHLRGGAVQQAEDSEDCPICDVKRDGETVGQVL